eukprot:CAMPEP_0113414348 /NCGR_PEP_ID=MMETSP0013_2-20120614/23962_1 /TAXON_ID=2843 ORGANISM="Skeletonema costatum, Strain 1716" /NCGR_SAMPLE_ID=MMETSP0013_2 /ASSEMBLY_ACC=CAM_ASM_000158 /LENGTH=293 /DNA_ID=CAMNT_0000301185 /DNA_START=1 /DNA_END=879 /DNA_ORIENTATION=- /assembly_acc=CAM_ASM_000158
MAEDRGGDEIFVYTGGDQVVPRNVRRVRIDKSVKIIPREAFFHRQHLIYVEFHDGIERIKKRAFEGCELLRSVKLLGVKVVEEGAFAYCRGLIDVEFGVELETLGTSALLNCTSLRNITMPSVTIIGIGYGAFSNCRQLTDLDLPEGLETIEEYAFNNCHRLRRIALPPKDDMIEGNVFYFCPQLTTVDLVGGIHKTAASLHLESWRSEMKDEINRINQVLPNTTSSQKTAEIRQWMESVTYRMSHYKGEHIRLLKEATTLLELALWKAKIDEKEDHREATAKRVKIDVQSKR